MLLEQVITVEKLSLKSSLYLAESLGCCCSGLDPDVEGCLYGFCVRQKLHCCL